MERHGILALGAGITPRPSLHLKHRKTVRPGVTLP